MLKLIVCILVCLGGYTLGRYVQKIRIKHLTKKLDKIKREREELLMEFAKTVDENIDDILVCVQES